MEAYKKLKARKNKHTHIKPPKKDKKKPPAHAGGGAKSASATGATSAAPHEHRRPETVIDEEGVPPRPHLPILLFENQFISVFILFYF
jgi:hypothetical protein